MESVWTGPMVQTTYREQRSAPGLNLISFVLILFTNNFPSLINENNFETIIYVDDTTLLFTNNTAPEHHYFIINRQSAPILPSNRPGPSKITRITFSTIPEQIPDIPVISVTKSQHYIT